MAFPYKHALLWEVPITLLPMPPWSWFRLRITSSNAEDSGPPVQVAVDFSSDPTSPRSLDITFESGPIPSSTTADMIYPYIRAGYQRTTTLLSWIPTVVVPQVSPVVRGPSVVMADREPSEAPTVRMHSVDRSLSPEDSVDYMSIGRDTLPALRPPGDHDSWTVSSTSSYSTARPDLSHYSLDNSSTRSNPYLRSMRMDVDGAHTSVDSRGLYLMDIDDEDYDVIMASASCARLSYYAKHGQASRNRMSLYRYRNNIEDESTLSIASTASEISFCSTIGPLDEE